MARISLSILKICLFIIALLMLGQTIATANEIDEIKKRGVLRHLSVPYANFNTGSGDGLDIDLMRKFAVHLGVNYEYIQTGWATVLSDLTGKTFKTIGDSVEITGSAPIKGDLIANGLTILPWRTELLDFSIPTFPSGVWLMARADHEMTPIPESGNEQSDIDLLKSKLSGVTVMGIDNTCLDYRLYDLDKTGAKIISFPADKKQVNELVPSLLNKEVGTILLDVPDALLALRRWPTQIKVLGPVSGEQKMGVAFRKEDNALKKEFNAFYSALVRSGRYQEMVKKYYPDVQYYFKGFFKAQL